MKTADNFDILKFEDLKFNEHAWHPVDGTQAIVKFTNGYGASVVKTATSYGGNRGLYELAVLGIDGHISYDTPITNDVLGYLNESDVSDVLLRISKL
jgi:hypothetical protein